MENIGEIYYQRGIRFFELEQYENAVTDLIQAYQCGYEEKRILEDLYKCFVLPNENEFQHNYEKNKAGITKLHYDDCSLDFIPISEMKFFIFDRSDKTFKGSLFLEDLSAEKDEECDIMYTDTWDVRIMLPDLHKKKRKHIYVLLSELESKFASFLKLPNFKELYLNNFTCFSNEQAMYDFFLSNNDRELPVKVITKDEQKYIKILEDLAQKKMIKKKWFGYLQWTGRIGTNKLKRKILKELSSGESNNDLENEIKKYEMECPMDLDLYILRAWQHYIIGDLTKAYDILHEGLEKNPFNILLIQFARQICIDRKQFREALEYDIILITFQNVFSELPEIEGLSQELLVKIAEQRKESLLNGDYELAAKCVRDLENVQRLLETSVGFHDHKYYWSKLNPISKTVGTFYEDVFGNKKYNALYEESYINKILPYLKCSFDNWVLVKLDCREVSSTKELLLEDDAEYLLPVLQEENTFTYKFVLSDDKEIICLNKCAQKFEYYRLPPATRLVSEKYLYVGNPIALKQNPKNKKLVLNIFVDGISQKVIEEENFAELMPYTNAFFSKGIRCNQAYSAAEWTLPSLASYTSGITPARHMIIHNNITNQFPADLTILAEYFKEQGYQTAKIDGDWRSTQSYGYGRGMDRIIYQHQNVGMKVEQVIEDTLDHIKLMQETNQFIWMCIGDLHNIADGIPQSPSVQASLPLESRAIEEIGITSVKQNHSINKRIAYMKQMKYIDDHLAVLYRYIEDHYKDDEIVISLFGDHGQGYLVEDGRHFLSEGRSKVGMMFRSDLKQGTVCEELISACDYVPIMCKLAGIPLKNEPIEGQVPLFFGGEKERKYALTESLHPGDPYRAAIVSKEHVFYFTAEGVVEYDGRFELGNYQCQLFDKEGNECSDREEMDQYLDVLMDHIGSLLIY